jgi:hypothetical protein
MERNRTYNYVFCFLVFVVICLFTLKDIKNVKEIGNSFKDVNRDRLNYFIFSKEKLIYLMDSLEIKNVEIVYAQAILETGNFTSYNFKYRQNLFGFYNGRNYLYFRSWVKCVKYYKNWQQKRYKDGDYYTFLKRIGYAEDSLYINKLKWLVKNERSKRKNK